jgi:folate-binding Fe-S cluster repair protein YgfZ
MGKSRLMQLRKVIERRLRRATAGGDAQADVHAVVAANVGERGAVTTASSHQTVSADRTKKADPDAA